MSTQVMSAVLADSSKWSMETRLSQGVVVGPQEVPLEIEDTLVTIVEEQDVENADGSCADNVSVVLRIEPIHGLTGLTALVVPD